MKENQQKQIAVVTGASSGLGRELVSLLDGESLSEIWVIARRADRLAALQQGCRTPIVPLALDLTDPAAEIALAQRLAQEMPCVRWLVNAAGVGKIGSYAEVPAQQSVQMVDLNCRAPVAITQEALPYMNRGAHILQVCSIAAFQPLSYLNVYAASKAFLYRYSRALRVELAPRGISVTALCPYWIRDTEFIGVAQAGPKAAQKATAPNAATDGSAAIRRFPFASRRADVAKSAFRAAKRGRAVCTPGPISTVERVLGKLLPSSWVLAAWEFFRRL